MVIAQIQSENLQHPVVPNLIAKGVTGNCGSVTTQSVATGVAGNSTVSSPHATTAQELMAVDAEPIQKAVDNFCRQDTFNTCQRIEKARWRCRPLRVVPLICRNRACRNQHWQCLLGVMLRTAQLARHNQQLQRLISELQRETDVFLKSAGVQSPKTEETTTSDSESIDRSPSPVDMVPPNSVESTQYDSN